MSVQVPNPFLVRLQFARDAFKMASLRDRHFDGHFATLHQSGNHWIRHIICYAIAKHYGLPEQVDIDDIRLIGEPKVPPIYDHIPQVVLSHRICSGLVHIQPFRAMFKFPKYVVLVRDLKAVLVSHYERFKVDYNCTFSEYLRGDIAGRRFSVDIWDCIRFMNAWGKVIERLPKQSTILRYEELRADPAREAHRIWDFLGFPVVDHALFIEAVAASTKEKMAAKEPAAAKTAVVRSSNADPATWYSEEDRAFYLTACQKFLRASFGYDYSQFNAQPGKSTHATLKRAA